MGERRRETMGDWREAMEGRRWVGKNLHADASRARARPY